jgi:hypothetical protein
MYVCIYYVNLCCYYIFQIILALWVFVIEQHRNYYYAVRAKAERNANYDVSMIVDAAGGQGTIYQPRMMTVAKNEPERHTMLKTTCTFTKVHGLGTLITQSFPDLEGKGSNLTLECIYHALQTSITLKKMRRVRNLYVQVDNASSNKSWTLLAGLAALVLTGVVRKVRNTCRHIQKCYLCMIAYM